MSNVMAVFQDVDTCMRCRGCVISCKRTWKMKALNPGVHKVAPDQRVIIKSQRRIDNGPFVRFSCWHCPDPPCVKRCPFNALTKQPNGAVSIDPDLCDPSQCDQQCLKDCKRAGYPKIGVGSDLFATEKAWKCTLCYGRSGSDEDLDPKYGDPLPRNFRNNNNVPGELLANIPELAHEPSCVYTCPAKAMKWGTRAGIRTYINDPDNGYISAQGDGSMYWASKRAIIIQPKADPFIEDHVTPMVSNLLTGPFAKAALVPTIFAGGLLAVIARRQQNMEESAGMREG
jgi:Fe-S-cluster-containing dehydrogenase component